MAPPLARIAAFTMAAALAAADAGPAAAQPSIRGAAVCEIAGYTADPDPQGTNIRAAPRRDAAILGRLPPPRRGDGDSYAPAFDIIDARNGWLLIRNARDGGPDDGPARPMFQGSGWISGGLVSFTINHAPLRDAPRADARIILQLQGEARGSAWGPDSATVERVHGCRGRFAEVSVRTPDGRRARGWASGICASQVTTCP